jgi:hypothetical protein
MTNPDHVSQPGDHKGPYSCLSNEALNEAYERVAADPDDQTAPMLLAELQARSRDDRPGTLRPASNPRHYAGQ